MKYLLPVILLLLAPTVVHARSFVVPFTSQAPHQNWSQPWQDACEEATIAMTAKYYEGTQFTSRDEAATLINRIVRMEDNAFGFSLDEGAEAIAAIINGYFPFEAWVVENPSLTSLKAQLDMGRPVIVPTYGKALRNPHFIGGGPDYHTIVLSGYDDGTKEFITQEPGTRHGLDFRYSYDTLLDAMHDLVPGKRTFEGKKVVIFTSPGVSRHADIDMDQDGLTKTQELAHGTVLYLQDSDGDGFSDGLEVKQGYLPTRNESIITSGVVRSASAPTVYELSFGEKRAIANAEAFRKRGWQWSDVQYVSEKYLTHFTDGQAIID